MCYGDTFHGNDGYYLEYLRQMEEEQNQRQYEEQQYEQEQNDS